MIPNDMSIHFDVEETMNVLVQAEQDYNEWLDMSDSFLGWLLTLNDQEFAYIHQNMNHDFAGDPDKGTSFLFTQLEAFKRGQHILLMSELTEDLEMKITGCNLIALVRQGEGTYEVADKDEDWTFTLTEKGEKLYQERNDHLKSAYEKRRNNISTKSNGDSE